MSKDIPIDLINLFESEDGLLFEPKHKTAKATKDDRLTESFNEIQDYVDKNDCLPSIDSEDISEAQLAHRLNSIKANKSKVDLLKSVDMLGLLDEPESPTSIEDLFEKDPFGLFSNEGSNVLNLSSALAINKKQQRPIIEQKAKRKRAADFENFRPLFAKEQQKLADGSLKLTYFTSVDQLKEGGFYVQDGMMLCLAEFGEKLKIYDHSQQRLRVIYENGVESNMFRRSLAQRLYEGGLVVVPKEYNGEVPINSDDKVIGYIYVLKSKSSDEKIQTIKNLYKIGFTTTPIEQRIKEAIKDPTYLMADVEIAASFVVTGDYNPQKIEHFLHRIFADAAIIMTIIDNEHKEYKPKEWYSVPLHVVEQAVGMLNSGEIVNYTYDVSSKSMRLVNK